MRPAPVEGPQALPLPGGEPAGLWGAAAVLRAAAAAADGAPLASSGGHVPVLDGWSGEAATAAEAELVVVAGRESAAADRLTRAAAVLCGYADELDAAQRGVATLQGSWDAALPADPLASLPETVLPVIATTYGVVAADLRLAADVAAHRLRALLGEAVAVDRPGRSPAHALGWADPPPSDDAVRWALLADLPVVAGVVAQREAQALVTLVLTDLAAVTDGDTEAAARAAGRLGARSRDPVVAQALWERLDPEQAGRLVDVLTGSAGDPGSAAVLLVLGATLAAAANPVYAAASDPATRARLDAWREPWLAGWAAGVGSGRPTGEGRAVAATWVQGVLLTGAARSGLSPGSRYAATVGVAMVEADRAVQSAETRTAAAGLSGPRTTERDPVLALARALDRDGDAARTWLSAPLPGSDRLVVEQLVRGRYLSMDPTAAAASMAATTHLVATARFDAARRDSVALDAALLGAVGAEASSSPHPDAYRVVLAPALADLGAVLARHPDAIGPVLDDSAAPGVDARPVPPTERLTRPGRTPLLWEAVLPGRPEAAALLGALALDGPAGGPRDPGSPPAVAQVLGALGTRLDADLVDAVAADGHGDTHALDAAARRLGEVVGFTLTSAGDGLAARDADVDERNRVLAGLAEAAAGKVVLPGPARVASPLVRMAANRVVAATLPTDAEAAQRRSTTRSTDDATDGADVEVRALVSRARPWTVDQSPQRWADRRGAVRFWDDAGVPLPESAMTTAQRQAFTTWRREMGLSVYDTAPVVVQDGVAAGVRAAVRSVR